MKINPGKSKAVSFTRARAKDPLNYFRGNQRIPKASSCKYLGIIIRSDLSWTDPSKLHSTKSMKATSFHKAYSKKMYIYSSTKSLAYTSLENPILGYGAANCDPHRERHVNTLNRVQKKDAKFANYSSDSVWETLAQRRIARICALFKAYSW